jgi:threonine/homoserine/homoserine lactone efflux protein
MTQYWTELAGLMAVFAVMIVAPGADFALVIRQAIVHGRRAAMLASALILWFLGVSIVFTSRPVREGFLAMSRWFNRVTGVMFIGLGLAFAQARAG